MQGRLFFAAFAACLLLAPPSHAADMAWMNGTCDKFIMSGKDVTKFCANSIVNSSYPNGRVGFTFILNGKRAITISGTDLPNPTPDTDRTYVDLVIVNLNEEGVTPEENPARGVCEYSNPYKGKAFIRCEASMGAHAVTAEFTTDGTPPQMSKFK